MATRTAGDPVVDFVFKGVDGKTYSTAEARRNGLLMLVFYKVSCPVCQLNNPVYGEVSGIRERWFPDMGRVAG